MRSPSSSLLQSSVVDSTSSRLSRNTELSNARAAELARSEPGLSHAQSQHATKRQSNNQNMRLINAARRCLATRAPVLRRFPAPSWWWRAAYERHFDPLPIVGISSCLLATPDRRNFVGRSATSLADRRRYPTGSTMFCFAVLRLLALPSLEKQKRCNPRLQTGGREVSGLEGTTPYSEILCPKTQAFGRQRRKFYTCRGDVFDNDHRASKTHPPGSTVIDCSRDLETFCSQLWESIHIDRTWGIFCRKSGSRSTTIRTSRQA